MIELNSNIRSLSHSTASATFSLNEDCDSSASTREKLHLLGKLSDHSIRSLQIIADLLFEDFFHTGLGFMHSLS